jgi:hypothetical protein
MSKNLTLSRRTVLKGFGTAIALPLLDAMTPALSLAAPTQPAAPTRMAFFYVPNGMHMADWTPAAEGPLGPLPAILEPLQPVQKSLMVLSGLTLDKARPNGDGPGDHARAMSAFLTGRQARKTAGADIRAGVSVDQLAASQVGKATRFPSLELGIERGLNSGNCDSGYSCAYSANLSWKTESMPMAKEINPRLVFERLFGNQVKGEAEASRAKRERYQLSILDFVLEDASQLKNRMGANDQRKLDEYLNAVREIEVRIARADAPKGDGAANLVRPAGIPPDYQEHMRLLCDMLVLAFQGDLTRIATFVFANDGSNRSYRFIGVPEGHHDLSHHGGLKEKQEKIRTINRFHISQFAYLLEKLQGIKEGEGTLLDNCMIVYGSGIGDGNRHNHDELPILLAGKGGGTLQTGRHIRHKQDTPLTNLYVSMLNRMGVSAASFGDSTGPLESLSG